ncbi:MAG: hypothetical protein GOMPHAMPRED_002372 [Gomphillus americanus]|uniref:DUF7707 domain-containing protein n=1 Tax=Gomphillus americanus TaxID=1940652 RepID=A0A8H3F947_9LECA|nr:MAG: hypothetical protein GOMPHAMPRED_002372 [Gomphillus americanus]
MVYFLAVLSSTLLASIVIAQTPNASFNQSVVSQVAGEIDPGTKASWCNGQNRACNVLCDKSAKTNTCDSP